MPWLFKQNSTLNWIIGYIFPIFSKRKNEQRLLQQAKDYSNQLAWQKQDLDKADTFPDNSVTEVSQMRETLLNYHNDLAQTEERLSLLSYKIEW